MEAESKLISPGGLAGVIICAQGLMEMGSDLYCRSGTGNWNCLFTGTRAELGIFNTVFSTRHFFPLSPRTFVPKKWR